MANQNHLNRFLSLSVRKWNEWRSLYPNIEPDLSSYNFENVHKTGVNLSNAYLKDSTFRNATLSEVKFIDAVLRNCIFERLVLSKADFSRANLQGSRFYSLKLDDVEFRDADLRNVVFGEGVHISRKQLSSAITDETTQYDRKLNTPVHVDSATHSHTAEEVSPIKKRETNESLTISENISVTKIDDPESILKAGVDNWNKWRENNDVRKPDLGNIQLFEIDLSGANLSGVFLYQAILSDINLSEADLSGADLTSAILTRAVLSYSNLSNASLNRANITQANAVNAIFKNAEIQNADLSFALLQEASFERANLIGTIFDQATIFGVDFTNANLSAADLSRAIGLTKQQIESAIIDENTRYPSYIEIGTDELNELLRRSREKLDTYSQEESTQYAKDVQVSLGPIASSIPIGPEGFIASDKWTTEDRLGYGLYAYAISRFLEHPKTNPPLTISIHAPWGGGKSSLMKMIKSMIDSQIPNPLGDEQGMPDSKKQSKPKNLAGWFISLFIYNPDYQIPFITTKSNKSSSNKVEREFEGGIEVKDALSEIENKESGKSSDAGTSSEEDISPYVETTKEFLAVWFNPWKYENTDQIWAGLADAIVNQLTGRLSLFQKELFLFRLNLNRIDGNKIRVRIYDKIIHLWIKSFMRWILLYVLLFGIFVLGDMSGWIKHLPIIGDISHIGTFMAFIATSLGAAIQYLKANHRVKEEPADASLGEFINVPNYSEKLGFVHQAEEDIRLVYKTFDQSGNRKKIVIFIDDLDRCSPTKIAAVFEGINLFLASDFIPCFFIIGMDSEVVSAALNEAHKGLIDNLPSYTTHTSLGSRYMDKFVQLPFVIPPPTEQTISRYTESLLADETPYQKSESSEKVITDQKFENSENEINESEGVANGEINIENQSRGNSDFIKNREILEEQIKNFSDSNPEIKEQILSVSTEFSNNPRDIKRFINAYRYNYFIRSAINIQRQPALDSSKFEPSLSQLSRWIILSMRWPELTRWLLHNYMRQTDGHRAHKSITEDRLNLLIELFAERGSHTDNDFNVENWAQLVNSKLGLKLEEAPWFNDPHLMDFFIKEGEQEIGGRLLDACGKGFW